MTFVDSNVVIYALLAKQAPEKHRIAKEILSRSGLATSSQVVNEVAASLRKKAGLDDGALLNIVSDIYDRIRVVDQISEDIFRAFELRAKYNLSYWDSLIAATARRVGADTLLTEDAQDGLTIDRSLMIKNPFRSE